ncbi:MAG: 2-oxoacid:ferredoxin oxidoreductase subunit beta, partial [Candidatus Latescibacteria bacterium]|nr:2-oxoacid:ferredoxin oxidoreductase subunit beta [Candidatus Latescibacterota bacterium]
EIISQCPVHFGKWSKTGNTVDMMEDFKARSVPLRRAKDMAEEELVGKLVVGELVKKEAEGIEN